MLLCYSQACQNTKNPTKLNKELEESRDNDDDNQPILKNDHPLLSQWYPTKIHSGMEMLWSWFWS